MTRSRDMSDLLNGGETILVSSGTTVPLTIQNNGTGNSFVVNDEDSDTSPFVINASGNVGIGINSPITTLHIQGIDSIQTATTIDSASSSSATIMRRSNGTAASKTVVANSDTIGAVSFQGYDGTAFRGSSQITARVDGTTGANEVPGALLFSTRPVGGSNPVERMRIDSAGRVGIGRTPTGIRLELQGGLASYDVGAGGNPGLLVRAHPTLDAAEVAVSTNHPLLFGTNGTERMRIDASGLITANATNEGQQYIPLEQFFYRGANATGITTAATNPYGVSPNLTAFGMYEFEYWLGISNNSTGIITLGWASTSVTRLIAEAVVLPQANSTAFAGVNPFINTTNKTITGGNSAATHWIKIRGFVIMGAATARLPIQVSVSAGTITPLAGSWFKFTNRGVSASGTSNITYGNVA